MDQVPQKSWSQDAHANISLGNFSVAARWGRRDTQQPCDSGSSLSSAQFHGELRGAGLFYHYQSDIGLLQQGIPSWGKGVTSQALPGEATPFAGGQHSAEGCGWEPSADHSSSSWGWARPGKRRGAHGIITAPLPRNLYFHLFSLACFGIASSELSSSLLAMFSVILTCFLSSPLNF